MIQADRVYGEIKDGSLQIIDLQASVLFLFLMLRILRCVRDFNLHNQEISQDCNILIIIKLLQINYITKYH